MFLPNIDNLVVFRIVSFGKNVEALNLSIENIYDLMEKYISDQGVVKTPANTAVQIKNSG